MAQQWGSSRIGQYSRQRPVFTENRYRETQNVSSLNLYNYQGLYDRSMLSRARDELCFHIEHMQDTAVWYRIRRKTDVNTHGGGASNFDDGFGEASTTFSHAELQENRDQDFNQTDFGPDPQDGNLENSAMKPTHTATSAATPDMVVDLTEHHDEDISNSSDCVVIEDEKCVNLVDKDLVLESDGLEIIEDKADSDVIVIDNITNRKEIEKPFNETTESDNNNLGQFSRYDNGNIQVQDNGNLTFKCDLCEFVSNKSSLVQRHLNEVAHFAASEYSIDNEGNMSLKNRMVLKNFKAKFKTVIVICPDCLKVFPDIHSCATHCNLQHQKENNGQKDRYGLIHVIQEDVCDNNIHLFKCQQCSKCFKGRQGMIQHIKDLHHYPFGDVNNSNKIFFCLNCNTSFDSFENVIYHQDQSHWKMSKVGVLQFAVFHYKSMECRTLLHRPSTPLPTKKRKHDGKTTEMEPTKKVAYTSTSTNDNVRRTSSKSSSNTTEKLSSLEIEKKSMKNLLDFSTKPNPEDNEDSEQESVVLSEVFKCDYCTKILKDGNQMYLHLVEKCHSSASTVLVDNQGNVMYLKNTKTILYEGEISRQLQQHAI